MKFVRKLLADLAKLKLPVTAAAVAALFLNVVAPFGAHIDGTQVAGVLAALGVAAAYVNHLLGD